MITETYRHRPGRSPSDARPGTGPRWEPAIASTPGARPGRATRQNVLLFVVASLFGLWLAVAAPSVSPVAPAVPPGSAAAPSGTAAAPSGTGPAPPGTPGAGQP